MPDNSQAATLRDVINYEPERYLSEDEMALIKNTFKGNKQLLTVLRKLFLPTVSDPSLPIEEIANDTLLAGVDWQSMPAEHIKPIILGRMEAIRFVASGLIKLRVLANSEDASPFMDAVRRKKDSAK